MLRWFSTIWTKAKQKSCSKSTALKCQFHERNGSRELKQERVFVAGHNGMVGSAIVRKLVLDPNIELILASL